MAKSPRARSRPTPALLAALRSGKGRLRRQRERMPLREKVEIVLELQRLCFPLIKKRRQLAPWERPWPTEP